MARIWRRRNRRAFRFTREGKVFVAVTIGVGLAAVNTGNNLLYLVLGLMLSLLLVSGTLSDVALWRVRLARRLPRHAFADTPFVVEMTLRNTKKRLPSFALEVEDRAVDESHNERSCFFLKLSPEASQTATYRRVAHRRGWLRFGTVVVRTRYPFGLIEKGRTVSLPGELLVYPKLVTIDSRTLRSLGLGEDVPSRRLGQRGDVRGVREYRDGDEARSIHWFRSAALDRLVVREQTSATRAHLTLLLDQAQPEHVDDEARQRWEAGFEEAISRTASIADAALRHGVAVEVRVRGSASPRVMPGAPPDPIFRFLALLASVPRGEAPGPPAASGPSLQIAVTPVTEEAAA